MLDADLRALARIYGAELSAEFKWRERIFPKYSAPLLVRDADVRRILPMFFGFIPFFEKSEKPKMVFHNARLESVSEKPSFKRAFRESRGIAPISAFFEYMPVAGRKRLMRVVPEDGALLHCAAIRSDWRAPGGESRMTFALITTTPPPEIAAAGHDRCPLFLNLEQIDAWLAPELRDARELHAIAQSAPRLRFAITDPAPQGEHDGE